MYLFLFFFSVIYRESILTLPTLKENVFQKYDKLAGPLREDFEETQIERIYQVLCDMPTLDVGLCVIGQLNDDSDAVQKINVPMTKDNWIKIHQNEVCTTDSFFFKNILKKLTKSISFPGVHNSSEFS